MRKFLCFFWVFVWSESATTLRQDWTDTCVLEPCKNDASEREERKSPNPGKRSAKRSVRVYAANCDCVTCLSKATNRAYFKQQPVHCHHGTPFFLVCHPTLRSQRKKLWCIPFPCENGYGLYHFLGKSCMVIYSSVHYEMLGQRQFSVS